MAERKDLLERHVSEYLSPAQVARRSPFTVKALERLRHLGRGPRWYRCGRRIVYKWSDVVAWIEQHTIHEDATDRRLLREMSND